MKMRIFRTSLICSFIKNEIIFYIPFPEFQSAINNIETLPISISPLPDAIGGTCERANACRY